MAKLAAKARKAMPQGEYALPGKRFPVNDINHARAALSGASRAENAGNITPAQKAKVVSRASGIISRAARGH